MDTCTLCLEAYSTSQLVKVREDLVCIHCVDQCNRLIKKEGISLKNANVARIKLKKMGFAA